MPDTAAFDPRLSQGQFCIVCHNPYPCGRDEHYRSIGIEDEGRCGHCGALPEADGDHSCPCPYRDGECPDHAW